MEEIYFGEELKEKLYNGINKLNRAVSSTMGPDGKTSIILNEYNEPIITKDGVSVARSISFKCPVENIGAQLIKQAAEKTVNDTGDGTTTSTVLATAFVNNLKDFKSKDINKAFDEIIPKVLEELKKNSRQLRNEDIKYVASISANNDLQIGELIQQAFDFSKIVKVEIGNTDKDILETIDGMSLDVSYFSKNFINIKNKGECILDKPNVLILDCKLDSLKSLETIIKTSFTNNKSLLIITEYITEQCLHLLESAVINDGLKLCVIKSPGFNQYRKDLLNDISKFTNSTIVTNLNNQISLSVLGYLESCKINRDKSLLIKDYTIDISELINELKEFSKTLESTDKKLIEDRIENLTAKVSVIKVGGNSEIEVKEKFDRYDDAIGAVSSALEEGIVEGAGYALFEISIKLYDNNSEIKTAITDSLQSPINQISNNGTYIKETEYEGFDDNSRISYFDQNIIDPFKVTRCALENAVSVAKTILSTESVILNQTLWNR